MAKPSVESGEAKKIEKVYYEVNSKIIFTAAQLEDPTPVTFANNREMFNWFAKNQAPEG